MVRLLTSHFPLLTSHFPLLTSDFLPACRRLLFPLLHAEKVPFPRATKEIGDVCTQTTDFRLPTFEVGSWKSEDPPRLSYFLDFTFCIPTQATRCYSRESFLSHSALFSYIQNITERQKTKSLKTSCSLKWESNMYQPRRAIKMQLFDLKATMIFYQPSKRQTSTSCLFNGICDSS